ncbi:glycosyltransferase family 2 protein [Aureimonas altamirensis]|uniref:glycosyltransferase family 2 protein n=1 Tax=Aureimonas altamirensis TaxID=370622 RepID=UPI0020374FDA|nr:glycosyltransferase family 2 protein [Aureimonas altamirensis]MCM2505986.1 glycosyltransferase family 2 protein [Aureimonas altamirensis]
MISLDSPQDILVKAEDVRPRSVPAHEVRSLADRKTRFCIVVPVINEGERIARQLRRMHEHGLNSICDIIIADGGSSDGSLTEPLLAETGVRALLTKTGPGKLSAQLRMGYAYALDEGYEGIVTIDGNGKDSVESVPLFVQALEEGVDYAQASRFLPGGGAVNTPWLRTLGIVLVHAPILSLAARRRFTDTTQGFRAYSARYLSHPKVQPFRDVFQTYELLAYLTVRAPQLGLRTQEIPTTRSYPCDGPMPTKLNGLGNLALIRILFTTLAGRYAP